MTRPLGSARRASAALLLGALGAALAGAAAWGPPAARAQDAEPGAAPHAPPPAPPTPGAAAEAEKGPNLQIPPFVGGAARTQLEGAIARFERAFAQVRAGKVAQARPELDQAITELEAVRAREKGLALPLYYLGIAYQLVTRNDVAVQRLEAATAIHKGFHEAWVELGDAYRWTDQDKKAEQAYDEAVKLAPDYAQAYKMRCLLRVAKQRWAEARADAARGLELAPKDAELAALEKRLRLALDGPDWPNKFTAESKNYVVHTNVDQAFADEISRQAELIRRLYEALFKESGPRGRKYVIVVFGSKAEYHQNGGPQGAGGHYDPQFKQLFLFRYEKPDDTWLVLYHEGFHQFLDSILSLDAPQWFNEGLADYFGPSRYAKEGRVEGMRTRPNPWRLRTVQQMIARKRTVPFERLMNMTQAEMYEPSMAGQHYAQAWSMVYFLAEAEERAYFPLLRDYFLALKKKKTAREAFDASFGKTDLAALEARWADFVGKLRED